ncbi:bifunctional transcriptional activator/DNA repair enzyme AdaA [Streptomyces sp. NPDC054961]
MRVLTAAPAAAASRYETDEERWRAVRDGDEAADGTFYYVVRTTGIYSRPSCVARLARRENVEFHSSLEEVRALGYRPCRRCHPDEPEQNRYYADTVARACRLMDGALTPPNLDAVARSAGYSRFHFHRMFKSLTGVTPYAYWTAVRARRVRAELIGARTVSDAIYQAGFNSNGQFYAASSAILGMTPQEFRAGGAGVEIRSAVGTTSLGPVLVAATGRGVCAVLTDAGDTADASDGAVRADRANGTRLRARLSALFPHAGHHEADPAFGELVAQALARAELPYSGRDLLPPTALRMCLRERIRQELTPLGATPPAAERDAVGGLRAG